MDGNEITRTPTATQTRTSQTSILHSTAIATTTWAEGTTGTSSHDALPGSTNLCQLACHTTALHPTAHSSAQLPQDYQKRNTAAVTESARTVTSKFPRTTTTTPILSGTSDCTSSLRNLSPGFHAPCHALVTTSVLPGGSRCIGFSGILFGRCPCQTRHNQEYYDITNPRLSNLLSRATSSRAGRWRPTQIYISRPP